MSLEDVVDLINKATTQFTLLSGKVVEGTRGAGKAGVESRKLSLELERLFLQYRKLSV